MYELFYKTGACSRAVHVVLNEIGTDFTLIPYEERERLLKANPRGQVPTLMVDGTPITEGAAIITYLADTHQSPLLPATGLARAKALQWLAFANSSLHPLYGTFFKGGEAYAACEFGPGSEAALQKLWDIVEDQLGKTEYLAGDQITAGDILTTVIAHWTPRIAAKITLGPKTQALVEKVSNRPSYVKAAQAEQAPAKSAA
jgi:glutathione S-transferase